MSSSNSSIITNLDSTGDKVYGSDKSKDVNCRSNVEMEQNFLDDGMLEKLLLSYFCNTELVCVFPLFKRRTWVVILLKKYYRK